MTSRNESQNLLHILLDAINFAVCLCFSYFSFNSHEIKAYVHLYICCMPHRLSRGYWSGSDSLDHSLKITVIWHLRDSTTWEAMAAFAMEIFWSTQSAIKNGEFEKIYTKKVFLYRTISKGNGKKRPATTKPLNPKLWMDIVNNKCFFFHSHGFLCVHFRFISPKHFHAQRKYRAFCHEILVFSLKISIVFFAISYELISFLKWRMLRSQFRKNCDV